MPPCFLKHVASTTAFRAQCGKFPRFLAAAPGNLPPVGWQVCRSERYGKTYFWNPHTGESRWECPDANAETVLSSDWQAVFSEAHGKHYFWHHPSGKTQWEMPAIAHEETVKYHRQTFTGAPGGKGVVDSPRAELLNQWRDVLHSAPLGEELQGDNLEVIKELLQYHPAAKEKIGPGLQGIKVDWAPPNHHKPSRCFWVLRTDGSQEDFSARKCARMLGLRPR
ncbi:unnamed protein product [Cladocopium goreaui]|uniref:WW domain-containing protein n=1 Tax=Cladocopium goreaui TaxID=2562237 RepID=A0A9P1M371_9DINO|nr:unnamed protein product [Cladocopium goreaui]